MMMNLLDFINQQETVKQSHVTHEKPSDCTVTKADADTLASLSKGRRRNGYQLTVDTSHDVVTATNVRHVVSVLDAGTITKYSLDVFESINGNVKLNTFAGQEICAYLHYIDYIYVGEHIDNNGRAHNSGIYGFKLVTPNLFNVEYISLDMFHTVYTKYTDEAQLLEHMETFIEEI